MLRLIQISFLLLFPSLGFSVTLIPEMTANNAPSGLASASTESGVNLAWKAMNRTNVDAADCWMPTVQPITTPQWLEYDFGAGNAQTITSYSITTRAGFGDGSGSCNSPKDFKLQGSNNDTEWVDLDTQTAQFVTLISNQTVVYPFTNTTAYRYYRFYETDSNGDGNGYVGEFALFGEGGGSSATITVSSGVGFGSGMKVY